MANATDLVKRLRACAKMFQFSGNEEEELALGAMEAADRIEALEALLREARQELNFYGDAENYRGRVCDDGDGHYDRMGFEVEEDEGRRARAALARINAALGADEC